MGIHRSVVPGIFNTYTLHTLHFLFFDVSKRSTILHYLHYLTTNMKSYQTIIFKKTMLFALAVFYSNAQQCSQTIDVCVEECDCCDSGWPIYGTCDNSLAEYIEICSGDGAMDRDPESYKLEVK